MKALVLTVNALSFAALLLAYTMAAANERPQGVRRALQTYAGQVATGAMPTLKPVWNLGVAAAARG